jgi:ATP-dependent DNA helicase RecG
MVKGLKKTLETPVRYIKGVGPKKSELLSRLGINTISDLLYYLPRRYEDRSDITAIRDLKAGAQATVQGEVVVSGLHKAKSGMPVFQAAVSDDTGIVQAVWFNQPYLKDTLKKGARAVFYGKAEFYGRLQLVQPEFEMLEDGETKDSLNMGRIVPVYGLTEELTQRGMRAILSEAISEYSRLVDEKLPTYMIARQRLVDAKFAIRNIHFPSTFEMLEKAYRRIVFEEFLALQVALALRARARGTGTRAGLSMDGGDLLREFKEGLPFALTEGQKKAAAEIERDISGTRPMNRLLEGDVGSGKTVVAAHALVMAFGNGFQSVVMAPTEVLARQHFVVLSGLLMPLGVNVALLTGGMDPKSKQDAYSGIRSGAVNVVVGTHAVIQKGVEFFKLGVVVIDEQHKFGVEQRALLRKKALIGENRGLEGKDRGLEGKDRGLEGEPHILVMTATPIPRTLALTVYGDLDISVIKELPKGRKPVVTYWVEPGKRDSMYEFAKEELKKGRQAYVVCPRIDSRASCVVRHASKANAVETFERLRDEVFRGYKVALLHGKMSSKEKEKVMKDFKKGAIDVLVSTVVIEVGIDVPNATVMIIENAESFGLSQLHQLRGRIGRAQHESYCILLSDPASDKAADRLKAIEGTIDGFEIAEADMEIRGPGEIFGTRQHGLPEIRFGNIARDVGIMEAARREAFALVGRDPQLAEEHHGGIRAALGERFKGRLELVRVG